MASFNNWIKYIRDAEKTSIIKGNVRKIHYTFPDGNQMAEGLFVLTLLFYVH